MSCHSCFCRNPLQNWLGGQLCWAEGCKILYFIPPVLLLCMVRDYILALLIVLCGAAAYPPCWATVWQAVWARLSQVTEPHSEPVVEPNKEPLQQSCCSCSHSQNRGIKSVNIEPWNSFPPFCHQCLNIGYYSFSPLICSFLSTLQNQCSSMCVCLWSSRVCASTKWTLLYWLGLVFIQVWDVVNVLNILWMY